MKAIDVFCGDSRAAAGARCIVKRALTKMRLPIPEDRQGLAAAFILAPWEFSSGIERAIEESKRAYERGDAQREQWKAEDVETLMALLNVQLDWPGLYPTYQYKGKVPKGVRVVEGYQLSHVWSLIREIRAANGEGL
jgi:hypothetical protein